MYAEANYKISDCIRSMYVRPLIDSEVAEQVVLCKRLEFHLPHRFCCYKAPRSQFGSGSRRERRLGTSGNRGSSSCSATNVAAAMLSGELLSASYKRAGTHAEVTESCSKSRRLTDSVCSVHKLHSASRQLYGQPYRCSLDQDDLHAPIL